jgi:hypothetical protein
MTKTYIGVDNGVTGSIAFIFESDHPAQLHRTPTKKEQSYTKKKQQITRVDWLRFFGLLPSDPQGVRVFIERPYTNLRGLKATVSGMRCLEATLIAIEQAGLSYEYVDSRQWQKEMLPSGLKGPELKAASLDVGIRLFPQLREEIIKQKDADALLIAEWARRNQR